MNEKIKETWVKPILIGVIVNGILLTITSGFAISTDIFNSWIEKKIQNQIALDREERQKWFDKQLAEACKAHGLDWYECRQMGVMIP